MISFSDGLRYSATGLFTLNAVVLAYHGNYPGALSNLWQVDHMFLRSAILRSLYKYAKLDGVGFLKVIPKLAIATAATYFYCTPDAEHVTNLHELFSAHQVEHAELKAQSIVGVSGILLSVLAFDYFVMNRVLLERALSFFSRSKRVQAKED